MVVVAKTIGLWSCRCGWWSWNNRIMVEMAVVVEEEEEEEEEKEEEEEEEEEEGNKTLIV